MTSLVRHSLQKHADRSFHCGDCGSDFQSKLELVRHKRLFCEKIFQKLRQKRVAEEIKRMTGKPVGLGLAKISKPWTEPGLYLIYFRCQRNETP